jgi:hypothetical protein
MSRKYPGTSNNNIQFLPQYIHNNLIRAEYVSPEISILPAALGPLVYSGSNGNAYRKHRNNVSEE